MINVSPVMTKFDYLRLAESRLTNVKMYRPGTYEVERLEMAVTDIQSKMTTEELTEYDAKKNVVLTPAQMEKNRVAMVEAMEANRDKSSI